MPKLSSSAAPKYRKHKASGQAIVTIDGKDHYLGPHRTAASRKEYDRVIAEWLANGRSLLIPNAATEITVVELMAKYVRFAKTYYNESSEWTNSKLAMRPLKNLYGKLRVAEFGPLKLKAVREKMIESNLCRNEINKRIGRIKRMFKWGVENEIVEPSVLHGLQAVRGLARGRSKARESEPVKPVPDAFVDAVEAHVSPQLWAMIELQRFTGMRPGEVTKMRTCDLDTSGNVWAYLPPNHKTEWRGHERHIFIGPRAQEVLKPWLRTELNAYLFQPREAVEHQLAERQKNRKTPLKWGNRPGSNRKRNPKRMAGEFYAVTAYAGAVARACEKAGVPRWSPHKLRHNAATWLRKEFGLDVARVVLGHRSAQVTEVYAELDRDKARDAMGLVG
jgi:integrase